MKADIDEKIEGMCSECKLEIEKNTCTRCGKVIEQNKECALNKNFDEEKFNALLGE